MPPFDAVTRGSMDGGLDCGERPPAFFGVREAAASLRAFSRARTALVSPS